MKSSDKGNLDNGSNYSLKYLDILKEGLSIEYTSNKRPIFLPDRIKSSRIKKLKSLLHDLHLNKIKDDAINDLHTYATSIPRKIQTTALGYASDFDQQIKLGLLLGERLVLWDTVIRSILAKPDNEVDINMLGKVVNSYLQIRPIIEAGDIVVLPQPKTWLERAKKYYELIPNKLQSNNTFKGCINANALLEEGFILHPYLMQNAHEYLSTINNAKEISSPFYSAQKAEFHTSLLRILTSNKLAILGKVNAIEFYEAIGSINENAMSRLKRELAKMLTIPNTGMSPIEKEQWLDDIEKELRKFSSITNRCMTSGGLDKGFAGFRALNATFGLVTTASSAGAFAAIISGIGALGNLGNLFRKIFSPHKDPILYQVFSQLEQAEERQTLKIIHDELKLPGGLQ